MSTRIAFKMLPSFLVHRHKAKKGLAVDTRVWRSTSLTDSSTSLTNLRIFLCCKLQIVKAKVFRQRYNSPQAQHQSPSASEHPLLSARCYTRSGSIHVILWHPQSARISLLTKCRNHKQAKTMTSKRNIPCIFPFWLVARTWEK